MGCMQENISNVVTPKKDKTLSSIIENNKNTSSSDNTILHVTNSGVPVIEEDSLLNQLALNIQSSMNVDETLYEKKEKISNSFSLENDWENLSKEEEVLATAESYLGTPYIWAANGPSAFDCSGYTKYVYKENGITLPRYSGHQANVGINVDFQELQKGDLVFFDTSKRPHNKVNHVGIYIGNNSFIHASSARKRVMITSFSEKKFYKRRFLHGQRIINSNSSFALYKTKSTQQTN